MTYDFLAVYVDMWHAVQFLPRPILKLHKRFPLGRTGLALRVVYDCPLEDLDNCTKPPARLLVRYNVTISLFVLTTFALDIWYLLQSAVIANLFATVMYKSGVELMVVTLKLSLCCVSL